jgi:NAD-dependent dihydropyrimidine dehydrogenase PreA subunit
MTLWVRISVINAREIRENIKSLHLGDGMYKFSDNQICVFTQEAYPGDSWIKTAVVNPIFYQLVVKTGPFHATDTCTGCGKCEQYCPLNNIILVNGKPQWGENCTHCMACICKCPAEAIEYGTHSNGKPRYQCPEYMKGDI